MSTTWFTSDLHLGDRQVLDFGRAFPSVREMNQALCDNWRSVVDDDDEVWILGDLARGSKLDEMLALVDALPGTKHLVTGNHDRCWPLRPSYGVAEVTRYLGAGFESIVTHAELEIAGQTVQMSHFPYRPAGVEHSIKPVDDGGWLLHGHIHRKWLQRDRQICVAVDAWRFTPVNIGTIELLIKAGPNRLDALPAAS